MPPAGGGTAVPPYPRPMPSTPWTLRGGVAAITGAGGGIGAALALELAGRGMQLALADLRPDALEATAAAARAGGATVSTQVLDVADRDACAAWPQRVLDAHGRVTLLVNNAGVALGGDFAQVDEADFEWLMAINFGAVVRLTRLFLPLLAREPAAQVANVSSIFGIIAVPGQTAYCASKFAVRGFSEALRHELALAGSPVGVTVVHPGGVRTGIAERARLAAVLTPEQRAVADGGWKAVLRLAPEAAARIIADGIARRAPRVLVGADAHQAAGLQRLLPVRYWSVLGPLLAARVRRA